MKLYKIYEIEDNVDDYSPNKKYPEHFIGAFKSKTDAGKLCDFIDACNCNNTKIVLGEVNQHDIADMHKYGFHSADKFGVKAISEQIKIYKANIKTVNKDDLQA